MVCPLLLASAFGFTEEESGFVNGGENLEGGFDAEETEEEVIANFYSTALDSNNLS